MLSRSPATASYISGMQAARCDYSKQVRTETGNCASSGKGLQASAGSRRRHAANTWCLSTRTTWPASSCWARVESVAVRWRCPGTCRTLYSMAVRSCFVRRGGYIGPAYRSPVSVHWTAHSFLKRLTARVCRSRREARTWRPRVPVLSNWSSWDSTVRRVRCYLATRTSCWLNGGCDCRVLRRCGRKDANRRF